VNLLRFFHLHLFYLYRIAASSTATDDVTNHVTHWHRILIANLRHSCASFTI